jgi:carboxyl-terminal processing protease
VFARGDESAARFVTPRVPAGRSTVEQFLSQATTLERDHRWGEALRLYSDAIRQFPDDPVLRDRQLVAQLHYDLNRRYADHGFCQTVQRTEASSALAVYAEVLNKIQTYHVQEPNWSRIAQMGGQSLEVALNDATFLRNASNDVSDLQAATASQVVRQTLANYRVASSQDAYVVTSSLARQLESRIGLLPAATVYEFIFGAMIALDPYSSFMTKNQFDETMAQIEGNFVGLGVELKTQPRQLEIVNVIPDGPAGQAGLQAGDLIEGVDAQRTTQIGGDAAADLLRGPEGSDVDLEIRRGERLHRLTLVRRQVDIPSVTSARMLDQSVGYVQIASFQKTTTRDFDAAIWRLNQQGMQELIVDVRGNPGGLLTAAVEVADRFLPAGVIVSTRGRNPLEDFVHRAVANGTWSIPLVVLVDENSASASEIFAAAIADHHRGRIVGSRSYGKGSVQGIFPLTVSGGGIRLTTAKFYSPSGTAIQDHGVKPDVEVHFAAKPAGEAAEASDAALAVALNLARQSAVR